MELVIRSAINAIDDLRAPGMVKLFFLCVGITTLVAFSLLVLGINLIDAYLAPKVTYENPMLPDSLQHSLIVALGAIVLITPLFLLFWSLMVFIASFFDEYIAEKIEKFRYPQLAVGQSHPFWSEFRQDVWFSIKILLINLVLLIPIFWPIWPIVFPLLNGYMLGRYFFCMAGGRHIGRKAAGELVKKHRGKILIAGLLMVFASGVPVLNLLVPFWGVAMMVHLYHLIDKPNILLPLPAGGT